MLAQLFSLFSRTVILTYLASVFCTSYFSGDVVFPVLFPIKMGMKFCPSSEADIVKLFTRRFPRYHAMSTSHMGCDVPKSYCIHDGNPKFDHLVFALLSKMFCGKCPSFPFAETPVIRGVVQFCCCGDSWVSAWPRIVISFMLPKSF